MARSSRRAAKKSSWTVNFAGVEARKLLPEDDYLVKVEEVTQEEGNNDPYLKFVFLVEGGQYDGQKLYYNASMGEKALWKLMALLEALGVDVPQDEMDIDPDDLTGRTMMAVVGHDTYEGKKQSKIMDFYAADEDQNAGKDEPKKGRGKKDKDEEDEAPKSSRRSRREKAKAKEPEKVKAEDVEDMDRDALVELIGEHELDVDPDDFKRDSKLLAAVLEALEEKDLLEEDEPEEPKKGAKGKSKDKLEKLESDAVSDMDEDELGEVIEKYSLDVDLDDFKTLRKKAAAVVDALEDAGYIED